MSRSWLWRPPAPEGGELSLSLVSWIATAHGCEVEDIEALGADDVPLLRLYATLSPDNVEEAESAILGINKHRTIYVEAEYR